MRILVTGATGFAGGHLTEAVVYKPGVEFLGLSRKGCWPAEWRHLDGRVRIISCDLCDREAVGNILSEWKPDAIFHLAGYARAGRSFREADKAWAGNLDATRNLLEAVRIWGGRPRILLVSSGLVYGDQESPGQACDERASLRPESPYAASKAAADLLGYQVGRATGLEIIRARPFNHIGPRQSAEFAVSHFARQIVEIEHRHRAAVLETGDLRPRRDLTDVRDIVRGYSLLMERGTAGEAYNLGSGEVHSMGEVLDRLLTLADLHCEVRCRADLVRDVDTPVLRADAGKARRELDWSPRIPLDETLTDLLTYWRQTL